MQANQWHDIPLLGTKSFIIHGNSWSRVSVFALAIWARLPQGDAKRVRWHLNLQWVALQKSNPELREASFYNGQ